MSSRPVTRATARLAALGVSAALAVGGAVVASSGTPAAAAATRTLDYSCAGLPTLGLPVDVPLSVDMLDQVTVPVGETLGTVTGTLGLDGLVAQLGGVVSDLLVTPADLTFRLGDQAVDAVSTGTGALSLPLSSVPLPALPVDLTAPQTFDLAIAGLSGALTCTLQDASDVVATLTGAATTPTTPVTPPTSGSRPPTTTPAPPHAAKHRAILRVHPTKKQVRQSVRARLRITVRAAGRPAAGVVVVRVGHRIVGRAMLRHGHIVLRLKRLSHGTKRAVVTYRGNSTTTPARKRLKLHITR